MVEAAVPIINLPKQSFEVLHNSSLVGVQIVHGRVGPVQLVLGHLVRNVGEVDHAVGGGRHRPPPVVVVVGIVDHRPSSPSP